MRLRDAEIFWSWNQTPLLWSHSLLARHHLHRSESRNLMSPIVQVESNLRAGSRWDLRDLDSQDSRAGDPNARHSQLYRRPFRIQQMNRYIQTAPHLHLPRTRSIRTADGETLESQTCQIGHSVLGRRPLGLRCLVNRDCPVNRDSLVNQHSPVNRDSPASRALGLLRFSVIDRCGGNIPGSLSVAGLLRKHRNLRCIGHTKLLVLSVPRKAVVMVALGFGMGV